MWALGNFSEHKFRSTSVTAASQPFKELPDKHILKNEQNKK